MPSAKKDRTPRGEPGRDAALDAHVRQFAREAAGDPRLTSWEENFLVSVAGWVAPDGPGAHRLTERQWAIIAQITAKVEAPLPGGEPLVEDADLAEDLETAPEDAQIAEDIEPA